MLATGILACASVRRAGWRGVGVGVGVGGGGHSRRKQESEVAARWPWQCAFANFATTIRVCRSCENWDPGGAAEEGRKATWLPTAPCTPQTNVAGLPKYLFGA